MIDSNLADLCPEIRYLAQSFVARCNASGLTCKITITWRDPEDQNAAKATGLSNACSGQSPHNSVNAAGQPASQAFDFALFNPDYITNGADPAYAKAGAIAESLGLTWGGRWHHPDFDHCELVNWKYIQPT